MNSIRSELPASASVTGAFSDVSGSGQPRIHERHILDLDAERSGDLGVDGAVGELLVALRSLARRRRRLKNSAFCAELVPPRTIDQLRRI